jgi:hypothetical protein
VAFYVKLGLRGLIFQIGTTVIGILGSVVYWRASRRRAGEPVPVPIRVYDANPET